MKFKETALILAGHGSTKNKDSSRHTRETAKRLQKRGIFKEVRAGFWKESPSFQEVFHGLEAKGAIVVPWFLTRGVFVNVNVNVNKSCGMGKAGGGKTS